jgi:hypothetical protein
MLLNEADDSVCRDYYSTFVRRGAVVVSLQPILEKVVRFAKEDNHKVTPLILDHEVAFSLFTAVIPTRALSACGKASHMLELYAYRFGMTIAAREMGLNGYILRDPATYRAQAYRYQWKYGAYSPVGYPVTAPGNEDRMFGRFVRQRLMYYARSEGMVYLGMGDEQESVINALEYGVKATHLGFACLPRGSHNAVPAMSVDQSTQDVLLKPDVKWNNIVKIRPAWSLSVTLYYFGEFGPWGLQYSRNRRVYAESFAQGMEYVEWKPVRVAIIIPAGGGKTTMSRIFGALDVDDLVGDTSQVELKQLRRAALQDPRVWPTHNKLFWSIVQERYGGGVIFIHPDGHELADLLDIPTENRFFFKPTPELHARNIANREEQHRRLSELNLRSASGREYSSSQELEMMIEEVYVAVYGKHWRFMKIDQSAVPFNESPDFSVVSDSDIELSFLSNPRLKYMSTVSNEDLKLNWYYEPWISAGERRWYHLPGLDVADSKYDPGSWLAQANEVTRRRQERCITELAIKSMNVLTYRPSGIELPVFLFSITNNLNERNEVLRRLKELKKFIAVVITGRVARHWNDGFLGGTFKDGIFIRTLESRQYTDFMIRPDDVIGIGDLLTMNDLAVSLEFDETGKRRYIERLDGFEGRHPFMSLWGAVVKGVPLFNTTVQSWINSQTHLARTISAEVRRLFGESLDVFRKVVFLNMWPDAVLVESTSITGIVRIEGRAHIVAPSGHLINMLLMSAHMHVDIVRYMNTVEWNVAAASSDPAALKLFDWYSARDLLAEKNSHQRKQMWHGYWDYYLAVCTALQISKTLKLPIPFRTYAYVARRLIEIKRRWRKFNGDGQEASEFRRS